MEITALCTVALAISAVSLTITKSGIFQEFRDWLKPKGKHPGMRKIVELFHCPFCMSFWLALLTLYFYKKVPISADLLFFAFVVMGISGVITAIIYNLLLKDQ